MEKQLQGTEALQAECATDERLLVEEVRNVGYDIHSVYDLVNNTPHPFLERQFFGPYRRAYDVLIRHLAVPHHPRIREGIIRALTVKDGGQEVEAALLGEFNTEQDPTLRWVLANALRTVMPYHRRKQHPEIASTLKR